MTEPTFYTDPETGGRKEVKLARFDLIPPDILNELAEHYGRGAAKYGERNMENGYPWSLSYAAAQRHLNAWWQGEDDDPETEHSHLIATAWHCFTLLWFLRHERGTDDRPEVYRHEVEVSPLQDLFDRWWAHIQNAVPPGEGAR